jgi:hypothetical protein
MPGMNSRRLVGVSVLLCGFWLASPCHAKCASGHRYFCVPVTFEQADPKLKTSSSVMKEYCAGWTTLKGVRTGIVLQDPGPCPANGTSMIGNLTSICQDTGAWTTATEWFISKPQFCLMSHKQRRQEAKVRAGKIRKGMTREQIHEMMKDYEYIGSGFAAEFTEQYYGHPDVVIEIPFDEPEGAYSSENKVNGRAIIADMEMPQP